MLRRTPNILRVVTRTIIKIKCLVRFGTTQDGAAAQPDCRGNSWPSNLTCVYDGSAQQSYRDATANGGSGGSTASQ